MGEKLKTLKLSKIEIGAFMCPIDNVKSREQAIGCKQYNEGIQTDNSVLAKHGSPRVF